MKRSSDKYDARKSLLRAWQRSERAWLRLAPADTAPGLVVRSILRWCETALAVALSLRPDPALASLVAHPKALIPLKKEEWAKILRGDVGQAYLSVLLGRQGLQRIDNAVTRVPELVDAQLGVALPAAASTYLARAAELYLWGFDQEVYVASRAVLEAVLSERVPERRVRSVLQLSANERVGLGHRITVASKAPAILSSKAAQRARDIAEDAGRILHEQLKPALVHSSPLAVLQSLDSVLRDMWTQR